MFGNSIESLKIPFSFSFPNTELLYNKYRESIYSQENKNEFLNKKRERNDYNLLNDKMLCISSQSVISEKDYAKINFVNSKGIITFPKNSFFNDSNSNLCSNENKKLSSTLHPEDRKSQSSVDIFIKNEEFKEKKENFQNNNNILNNKISLNNKIISQNKGLLKLVDIKSENKNNFYRRKNEHRPDNIRDVIINAFFKRIEILVKKELGILKKIDKSKIKKLIEKMKPLEDSLKSKNLFMNGSQKVKDMFYTNKNLEIYYKEKNQKTKKYIWFDEFEKKNKNNKEIINQIEDMYEKIEENEYQKIKDNILVLHKIFNTDIRLLFIDFTKSDKNKQLFIHFKTLDDVVAEQKKKKKRDKEYIKAMVKISFNIAFKKYTVQKKK